MRKWMLSLLLAACMLLPLVPVMAMPAVAAEGPLLSSSYVADHQVSVTSDPMTYTAWAEQNGKADAMADAATQALYESYFYEHGQVVWSGDWMTGGIHRTTGVFEPIAYHTQFAGCTWSEWWGNSWYSTKSAAEFFLGGYFQSCGAEFNWLWENENVPFHVNIQTTNQARFSKTDMAYFSYAYTVPENVAGTASLSILSTNTTVNTTTHVMIMLNDEIVWPSGAKLSDVATWKTGLYNGPHLNAALGGLALEVEAGDQIHFVVTDESTKTVQLDPCVTISSERTWRPTFSTYAGKLGLPIDEAAFAAFCAQELDPNAESSKQAYLDYVLNHTERAWVGNWSAGRGIVENHVFVYEPLAYTDYYSNMAWSYPLSIGYSGFLLTKSQQEQVLKEYLLSENAKPGLWGRSNAVYGHYTDQSGMLSGLLGAGIDKACLTWTYTVPAGVSELKPFFGSHEYIPDKDPAAETYFCVLKDGLPIWPTNAKVDDVSTWAKKGSGYTGNGPTTTELNDAWSNFVIRVEEGSQISFAYMDKQDDAPCQYRFGVTNTDTGETSMYDPRALSLDKEVPLSYSAFCASNSPARAVNSAYAQSEKFLYFYLSQAYAGQLLTYAEFCSQPLDPNAEISKQAYRDYVLNETSAITWTGNWSAGNSVVAGNVLRYEPIAYRLYHAGVDWNNTADSTRYVTANAMRSFLNKHLLSNESTEDGLWGHTGVLYGQDKVDNTATGVYDLLNCKTGAILTWAYTVPQGVDTLAPTISVAEITHNAANSAGTHLCILRNGTPVWPANAVAGDPSTWARQGNGFAGKNPTVDDLNTAWKNVTFEVQEGDLLTFCVIDNWDWGDVRYGYRFGVTNPTTSKTTTYDPEAVTHGAAPMSYNTFCAAGGVAVRGENSGYVMGSYAKDAYVKYYMEQARITQKGDWRLGQLTDAKAFSPIAGLIAMNGKTAAAGYAVGEQLYATTEAGLRKLLGKYLAGETVDQLSLIDDELFLLSPGGKHAGYAVSTADKTVTAYRYTMPQNGRVRLSLGEQVASGAYVCVLHNGEVVWPSGASYGATNTWASVTAGSLASLNASLADLALYFERGDTVDFCVANAAPQAGSYVLLMPRVEIFSPLAEPFALQGAAILGNNFGVTFYTTYTGKAVADSTTVSFEAHGKVLTPKMTEVVNADTTVTRTYTLTGFAAKELTDEIRYSFVCKTATEEKTVTDTITIASLLNNYLKVENGIVDTEDELSALALATLNYGASAQQYFSYRTDALANAAVPEAQRTPAMTIPDRKLADMEYRITDGATIHLTQASLLLNDTLQLKLGLDAEETCADYADLSLVVKTANGKSYTVGTLTKRDDDTSSTRFKSIIDIPMLHYGTTLTFGLYRDGELISDELVYGVGCYAKRMYGKEDKMDQVLDTMLTLGDAAEDYRYGVENALKDGAGIPALPGETIDLGQYPIWVRDTIVPGDQVTWSAACDALAYSIVSNRYVLAPEDAGEYALVATYGNHSIDVVLSVDADGNYGAGVVQKNPSASIDLSGYGAKAAETGATVPTYWEWSLNLAACLADQNKTKVENKNNLSSFLFVTDTHWEQNNKNTFKLANYLQAELGFDRLHFGGDMIDGNARLSVAAETIADWVKNIDSFNGKWYPVRGNHDQNASWRPLSFDEVWTDAQYYDNVLAHSDIPKTDEKNLYYYVDDEQAKIRYYFLADYSNGNTAVASGDKDTSAKEGVNVVSYAEQVAWLQTTAADLKEGWGIVVTEHRMIGSLDAQGNPTPTEFYRALVPVLNEIDKTREVIAVFSGHTHWDADILTEGGYYVISTTSDAGDPDPFLPKPEAGTNIEQRMDFVQIDRENRKIYITRIGAGENREFSY